MLLSCDTICKWDCSRWDEHYLNGMKICSDRPSTLTAQRRGGCMKEVSVSLPSRHHPSSESPTAWHFSPNRGRVGTPLVESSPSMTFPMANAVVSAIENKGEGSTHEGLGNEALWSKLCIRQHCCMIGKKRQKKKNCFIIVMSDFHYMYVQFLRDGVGREVKCGNIAVCWKRGWCDGVAENKTTGKASSFCILWPFVGNEWADASSACFTGSRWLELDETETLYFIRYTFYTLSVPVTLSCTSGYN